MRNTVMLSFAAAGIVGAAPVIAQNAAGEKQFYQACAACHTGAANSLGPTLKGVAGRKAGAVPGYRYSTALQRSGLTWRPANLRHFLINPQATVPGNRMPYGGAAPADADAIVRYLTGMK